LLVAAIDGDDQPGVAVAVACVDDSGRVRGQRLGRLVAIALLDGLDEIVAGRGERLRSDRRCDDRRRNENCKT